MNAKSFNKPLKKLLFFYCVITCRTGGLMVGVAGCCTSQDKRSIGGRREAGVEANVEAVVGTEAVVAGPRTT
ncbi:hypothetical protein GOP47_0029002 [Adiantum capillus-veneris]|nr:hypothetical protein GOP47_0029002 [Adiantum capillus-veneris]